MVRSVPSASAARNLELWRRMPGARTASRFSCATGVDPGLHWSSFRSTFVLMIRKLSRRAFSQGYLAVGVAVAAVPVLGAWKRCSEPKEQTKRYEDGFAARFKRLLTLDFHVRPPER